MEDSLKLPEELEKRRIKALEEIALNTNQMQIYMGYISLLLFLIFGAIVFF